MPTYLTPSFAPYAKVKSKCRSPFYACLDLCVTIFYFGCNGTFTRNPGVFGTTNRPGFPMPMKLIGKFASAANARSPIYRMTRRTVDQPADILPLSMLSDIIVAGYHPGDVVLIAMSHPTNFAIAQRDVVKYKRSNLFERIF